MVAALFWPHRDELGLARRVASFPLEGFLIVNLMDRMENRVPGAVNIPPGKFQTQFLTESLPRGSKVTYLGELPDSLCGQPSNTWRELSATQPAEMPWGQTTTFV